MGYAHPDFLLSHLTSHQMAEWIAFSRLEPFGSGHTDVMVGVLCSAIANFSTMEAKDKRTGKRRFWAPEDFVPDYLQDTPEEVDEKKQTVEEMKTMLIHISTAGAKKK